MAVYPRISGRLGNVIDLNITFYRNGVPTDPYAIRKVMIYRAAVAPENLVAEIVITCPDDPNYPSPLVREFECVSEPVDVTPGECPKSGQSQQVKIAKPGVFHLFWDVPKDGIPVADIFFDVWHYLGDSPSSGCSTCPEVPSNDAQQIALNQDPDACPVPGVIPPEPEPETCITQTCSEKFWLYPDGMYCDAGLETIRLGFEAIDEKFYQPEKRTLEVGLMPLPLYDYDYNLIAPILPYLQATLTLMTDNCEVLIPAEPMRIGLRQGTYRSAPFVLQYTFDTMRVLKGSYKYQIEVKLPNGETRVSPRFNIQVS